MDETKLDILSSLMDKAEALIASAGAGAGDDASGPLIGLQIEDTVALQVR
jgi:hypothetical protein